jgi:hypothetical protein
VENPDREVDLAEVYIVTLYPTISLELTSLSGFATFQHFAHTYASWETRNTGTVVKYQEALLEFI